MNAATAVAARPLYHIPKQYPKAAGILIIHLCLSKVWSLMQGDGFNILFILYSATVFASLTLTFNRAKLNIHILMNNYEIANVFIYDIMLSRDLGIY